MRGIKRGKIVKNKFFGVAKATVKTFFYARLPLFMPPEGQKDKSIDSALDNPKRSFGYAWEHLP